MRRLIPVLLATLTLTARPVQAESPGRVETVSFKSTRGLSEERIRGLPYLYLDCGTEDDLVGSNLAFAGLLIEKKIPHEYRQQPGIHNWELWDQQIRVILELAAQKLPRR